jgi:hypothetical protein
MRRHPMVMEIEANTSRYLFEPKKSSTCTIFSPSLDHYTRLCVPAAGH